MREGVRQGGEVRGGGGGVPKVPKKDVRLCLNNPKATQSQLAISLRAFLRFFTS